MKREKYKIPCWVKMPRKIKKRYKKQCRDHMVDYIWLIKVIHKDFYSHFELVDFIKKTKSVDVNGNISTETVIYWLNKMTPRNVQVSCFEIMKYLGVKIVDAEPMCEFDFLNFSDKGKAIVSSEYINREGYKVVYEDGYTSWSPKEVFEKAYRPITGLTFGLAIEALKQGKKVARAGWNGKGMYLLFLNGKTTDFGYTLLPYIGLKTVDDNFVPWVASQTDMLAEDWMIVE